jgi:hypothetical protein
MLPMLKNLFAFVLLTSTYNTAKTIPGITAVYDSKKKMVTVKWQQTTAGVKTCIVQRSADNFNWADIARMENASFSTGKTYQYNDYKTSEGENYYRLKCVTATNQTLYSASVMVITGSGLHHWVMYPVPVGAVLTLQYRGTEKISGVINVQIQNIQGKILTRRRCASNTMVIQIPVDNLGRGIYDIRITIAGDIVWNQRFVK